MNSVTARHALLIVLVAFACSGCSSREAAGVSGEVRFEGEPVEKGLIIFYPENGQVAGAEIVNGKYSIVGDPGAALGVNRVEITAKRKTGKKLVLPPSMPKDLQVDEEVQFIPEKYNKNSSLQVKLERGRNVHNFPLTK
ncbi:hypothetical protein SH661x_003350 [Planctomicrobium sp. SH661]|uniref:hypothetical protein n=1 Tax=Planctomicrobium sp. SH661 TaxID=3448124 RepID=UPI003F5C9978